MHKHGGFYSDLDCIPYKKVEEILELNSFNPNVHQAAVFKQFDMNEEEAQNWLACFFAQGVDPVRSRLGNSPLYADKPKVGLWLRMMNLALERMEWLYEREDMWNGDTKVANVCPEHLYPWAAGPDIASEAVFRIDGKDSPTPADGIVVVNAVAHNGSLSTVIRYCTNFRFSVCRLLA
jgi:hypothetical protein